MYRKIVDIWVGIMVMVFISACSSPASIPPAAATRQLSVSGTGTVSLVPDIAHINIGVQSKSEDLNTALADNSRSTKQVIQDLQQLGVIAEDIQTVSFNVYPEMVTLPGSEYASQFYTVENTVAVIVRDLSTIDQLLESVVRQGSNRIYGITYDVENKDQALSGARELAIQNAQKHAEELALSADIQLGNLVSVRVDPGGQIQPFYEGKGSQILNQPVPVSEGQIGITMNAFLIYEIQ